jgi:hypothetical protein
MTVGDDDDSWAAPPLRVAIGRALLESDAPMSASELGPVVLSHQSNVKKEAGRMADAGLITCTEAAAQTKRRGPSAVAFALTLEQRQRAARELPPRPIVPGLLTYGQEVLFASTEAEHIGDLMRVLREGRDAAAASWIALLGDEMLVAFEHRDSDAALGLFVRLASEHVPVRRAVVSRTGLTDDWMREIWGI